MKAPVPPPERTVSRNYSMAPGPEPESIYAVPPARVLPASQPPPERPISSIYFTSMRSASTPPPPPANDFPSPSASAIYTTLEEARWQRSATPTNQQPEEPLYESLVRPRTMAMPDPLRTSASDLRSSYHLRGSQTDIYHQTYASIGSVATLPRSRSIAGMPDRAGRSTPSGRPRANTTCQPSSVSWQGATQSVDV